MAAPPKVVELVNNFEQYKDRYISPTYKEAQLRVEFLNPFFEALGWDVYNKKNKHELYKEVIHEDVETIEGKSKAPDYSFRVGGVRKFFVEAKKPAINLKDNPEPAYQLRRYGWNAKLPISILTDFEEFSIYDCTAKPSVNDKPSAHRVAYFTYKDYIDKWDEIAGLFSLNAIYQGKFDEYADTLKKKKGGKGTADIDDAFLAEIEDWRDKLAKNIALRNKDLTVRELNLAIQKIIDRIVFLRICEDRGVEKYEQLKKKAEGKDVYKKLIDLFLYADDKYNSGIFHFRKEEGMDEPDILTTSLELDDKILKDIINRLYYPESPYEFSVLPSDILGQVYEQFLGKVIRLTASHQAKIEEKPEVKKAGGVYYTPTYIVDYIVKKTVGKLVEDKTPKDVSELKILDPACGSGSFLIGAYQYLLDWHLGWYIHNLVPLLNKGKTISDEDVKKRLPVKPVIQKKGRKKTSGSDYQLPVYQMSDTDWRLTTDEKKRILLNNIYGVDIDQQAVEVTKLSLLLKVLEGEKSERISKQLTITQERVLPSLHNNIKCGNSLIGPDIYSDMQTTLFDDEEYYRINPFDWNREFSSILGSGGFDVVIGNPPYVRIQAMKEWAPVEVEFYKKLYESAKKGNYDIYVVFVEKGINLLRKNGLLGYILPHKFFNAKYGEPLRKIISEGKYLSDIVHFGHEQVFKNASTYTCLLFLKKNEQREFGFNKVESLFSWRQSGTCGKGEILSIDVTSEDWNFVIGENQGLSKKLNEMPIKLGQKLHIFQGLVTGADKVFILNDPQNIEKGILRPFLKTNQIKPYSNPNIDSWIIFPYYLIDNKAILIPEKEIQEKFPEAYRHLKSNEKILRNREKGKWNNNNWYAYGRSQNLAQMEDPKLIIQVLALSPTIIYDNNSLYMTGGGGGPFYGMRPKFDEINILYVMGIVNSKLFGKIIEFRSTPMRGGYLRYSKQFIESAPFRKIDFSNHSDKIKHDTMVSLVEQILDLNKKLDQAKLESDKEIIKRRIEATDNQIDKLVYELYGLTEEEIAIVEGK